MIDTDTHQITARLERFAAAWLEGDADKLMGFWDAQHPTASFLPAELDELVEGHAALRAYYASAVAQYSFSLGILREAVIRFVGDIAHASCHFEWKFLYQATEFPVCSRITALLRKRDGAWYFLHLHESVRWDALN